MAGQLEQVAGVLSAEKRQTGELEVGVGERDVSIRVSVGRNGARWKIIFAVGVAVSRAQQQAWVPRELGC